MTWRVGIDFGTSNSGVAVFDGQRTRLLELDPASSMPQVVKTILYVTRNYRTLIGQEAVELYYRHNVNRLRRYVKKWVGEIDVHGGDMFYVRDVYVYVDELNPGRLLQYIKTALRSEGYHGTTIFERYFPLDEIITMYLSEIKRRAEDQLGGQITYATLGRPVQFHRDEDLDRKSEEILRKAALNAGFENVSFELEPVAAALFYEQGIDGPQNVLIFDFGGGTLDITIMRLGDRERRVYANGGIGIAGSDFDRAIIEKRMLPHFGLSAVVHEPDLLELVNAVADWVALPDLSTPKARLMLEKAILQGQSPARLRALESLIFNDLAFSFYNKVESSKIALSSQGAVVIEMEEKDIHLWELYTRVQFEKDISDYVERVKAVVEETVRQSGLRVEEIDAVVKTGGSSNVPVFSQLLGEMFGPEKVKESDTFGSVAAGLAIRAWERDGQRMGNG